MPRDTDEPDEPQRTSTIALLARIGAGDPSAAEALAERLQGELRSLAAAHLGARGRAGSLQPTLLVNEAWIRLSEREGLPFENRHYFLAFASKVMRGSSSTRSARGPPASAAEGSSASRSPTSEPRMARTCSICSRSTKR